jgi:hypothetical protein
MRVSRLAALWHTGGGSAIDSDHEAATAIRGWSGLTALAGQASGTFGSRHSSSQPRRPMTAVGHPSSQPSGTPEAPANHARGGLLSLRGVASWAAHPRLVGVLCRGSVTDLPTGDEVAIESALSYEGSGSVAEPCGETPERGQRGGSSGATRSSIRRRSGVAADKSARSKPLRRLHARRGVSDA